VIIANIKQHTRKVYGVTLLELLYVIALLIIVTSMAIPRLSGQLSYMRSKKIMNDIVAALDYVQNQALQNKTPHGLVFDLEEDARIITCYQENPNTILPNPLSKKPYTIEIARNQGIHGISITGAEERGENYYIEFTPLGEPVTRTHITITVSAADTNYTIDISKIGRITVH